MQKIKKHCHLFSGLSNSEFASIEKNAEIEKFTKWDFIVKQWVLNKNLYIIKKWIVKINFQFKEKNFITWFLKKYDYFWEIWLFSWWISKVEAVCISPCEIIKIKQEDIDNLIINSPIFVYNLLNGFAEKIIKNQETIHNLAFRNVKDRIIHQLIILAKIFRGKTDGKIILDIPITQEELSHFIWTWRENVTKALAILKKEWIIDIKTKQIIVLDEKN